MRKRSRIILLATTSAMVCVLAWLCARDPVEPRYHGRALSHWLDEVADEIDGRAFKPEIIAEGHDAIRAAGTNAIPYIIHRIKTSNTWINFKYRKLYYFVYDCGAIRLWNQLPTPRQEFDIRDGERAFWDVGHGAAPAAVLALKDSNDLLREVAKEFLADIRYRCETNGTLGELQQSVRPYLLTELEDSDPWVRDRAIHLFGRYGINDAEVVTALTRCLKDATPLIERDNFEPEYSIQTAAASALAKLGPAAVSAVPNLRQMLHNPEAHARIAAASALQVLQPDAATYVSVCIQELYRTNQPDVRQVCVEVLYRMGTSAKPALLKFWQQDEADSEVRAAVAKVIESIDLNAAANDRVN